MRFSLRYDMRAPSIGAPPPELYLAAVEQAGWADAMGFDTLYLAEHHGAEDGYCASPMILGAAMLGRTRRIHVHFSALVAVLHHPLRLAEDLATLDLVGGGGRVEMTMGIGYRPDEFEMFDVPMKRRVRILEEIVDTLDKAWTGEPFEFRGKTVRVRPTPVGPDRPPIYIGGSADASALRAARLGDNYMPAGSEKERLYALYDAERERLGLPIPPRPAPAGPLFLHVTDDPDRDWPILAPHLMYTTNMNAQWAKERGIGTTGYTFVENLDELKRQPQFVVVTPEQCVGLALERGDDSELMFQPLMGGLAPEIGWRSLELFAAKVLPELERSGLTVPTTR
ncbi:LLM class flavin-dependent oxidoreductase [Rhodococcus zopfii]|uniref:LLM class flavin-dependent oxidoreductase n=1 Tax=Rhodococcus zopfii TaxID=43772 RepID=A0ABU3WWL0_9NOCA|nr:LLM class flavin-dependent oxidoreductase [Rhodococcus zopfii]